MTDQETFRLAPPVVFWWVWLAFVAANAGDYAIQGLPSVRFCTVLAAILLLVTGLAYTLALRPRVYAAGDGITVLNPYRTYFVPWTVITAVDTGEWVEIHHAPEEKGSSAGGRTVRCWALYVSARARQKAARPPRRARDPLARGLPGHRTTTGHASARLPEEARYLASLPPAKAMAVRLDTRAGRERARAAGSARGGNSPGVTAAWNWPAVTAVVVPALILAAVAAA